MSVSLTKAFESVPLVLSTNLETLRRLHLEYFGPKSAVPEGDVSALLNVLEAEKLETVSPVSYRGILSEVETLVHGSFYQEVSKGEQEMRKVVLRASLRHLFKIILETVLVFLNVMIGIYAFYRGRFLLAVSVSALTILILSLSRLIYREALFRAHAKWQELQIEVGPQLTSAMVKQHLTTVRWSELEIAQLGVELPQRLHNLHRALNRIKSTTGIPGRLSVMVPSIVNPIGSETPLETAPKHFALFLRIGDVGCCYDIYCNGSPLGPRISLSDEQVAALMPRGLGAKGFSSAPNGEERSGLSL